MEAGVEEFCSIVIRRVGVPATGGGSSTGSAADLCSRWTLGVCVI